MYNSESTLLDGEFLCFCLTGVAVKNYGDQLIRIVAQQDVLRPS